MFLKKIDLSPFFKQIIFFLSSFFDKLKLYKDILLPAGIPVVWVFIAVSGFFISAYRVNFIYDIYTLRASGLTINSIEKTALKYNIIVNSFETNETNFSSVYENLTDKDKKKTVIITPYLFNALKTESEFEDLINQVPVYLFGPLFDYEDSENIIDSSIKISNRKKIEQFFKNTEKLTFYISSNVWTLDCNSEPEKSLNKIIEDIFLSVNKESFVTKAELKEKTDEAEPYSDIKLQSESAVSVFAVRGITKRLRDFLLKADGKLIFYDFINVSNLNSNLFSGKQTEQKFSLKYNYSLTLLNICERIQIEKSERIQYHPVYTFVP